MSTNEHLRRIVDLRNTAFHKMKDIVDNAEAEGRDLDAAEREAFDTASADMDALAVRAERMTELAKRDAATSEMLTRTLGTDQAPTPKVNDQAAALRAFFTGQTRSIEIMPTGSAQAAFRAARIPAAQRDLSKLSAGAGGNIVPTDLYAQIVQHLVDASGVLTAGATIIQTAGGESLDIPITTSHGAAALVAEIGSIAESDPVFSKRTLGAYKYGQLTQVSTELVADAGFDVISYIADATGRNVGLALGTDLAVGNASSKPSGITQTSTLGVTGSASVSGAFTADNLIDLYGSVIAPYRNSPQAAWLLRDATLAAVRKLKDSASFYLFAPGLSVGMPDSLLGKPVYTDPNIAAVATSAKSVVFGDISKYFVRLAGGVRFERSDEFAFGSDLISFRTLVRGDGILVDQTGAVKHFIGNAS